MDFRRLTVVPNQWGPVYHVVFDEALTAWPDDQRDVFWSVGEAVIFGLKHGRCPEVPDSTRNAWAHWTPEQISEYRRQCSANTGAHRMAPAAGASTVPPLVVHSESEDQSK